MKTSNGGFSVKISVYSNHVDVKVTIQCCITTDKGVFNILLYANAVLLAQYTYI